MKRSRRRSVLVPLALLFVATAFAGSHAFAQIAPPAVPATVAAKPAAAPQAGRLSIGPGLFTFPQIAALLSTPEQPITCDFAMKDRAAFVFLQNRSRDEAKELLGAGLQVEFLPAPPATNGAAAQDKATGKPSGFVMTRQKAVSEREALWLKRLARIVQSELQRKAGEVAAYDNKPLPDFAKIKKMGDEASALYRQVGNLDEPPQNEAMAQKRAEWDKLHTALAAESAVPGASERILAAWVRAEPASLVSVLQGKQDELVPQTVPPSFMQNGWAAQALSDIVKTATNITLPSLPTEFRPENYTWATRYEIGSVLRPRFSIRVEGRVSHVDTAASESVLAAAQHPSGKQEPESDAEKEYATALYYLHRSSIVDLFTQLPAEYDPASQAIPGALFVLGSDAIQWWKQEKADTDACLQNLPAELPAPHSPPTAQESPVLGGEILVGYGRNSSQFTLSDAAAYFAAKNNAELIMELHPRFERQQPHATSPNLSAWINHDGTGEQWTVREKNKVWLITNRLAFLERPQNVPLNELLQLRSDLQDWHKQNDAAPATTSAKSPSARLNYLPYAPLATYARAAVARREGQSWTPETTLVSEMYHGIHLNVLDENVAAIYLWSKISEADRNKIIASLTLERESGDPPKDGKGRVRYYQYPMSRLSGVTLSAAAQFMHEFDQQETETPELINRLRSCNLRAAWIVNRPSRAPKFYRLSLSFVPASQPANGQINSQAQILMPNPTVEKAAP